MLFVFGTAFVQSLATEIPFAKLEAIIVGGDINSTLIFLVPNCCILKFIYLFFLLILFLRNYEDRKQR